jgi:predicted DsbA family dithiol-disulfide isomerase
VPLTLRIYTDFVCPFCFIAEETSVPRLLGELDLVLDWHGFELHPGTPPGGVPLGKLFPGVHLPSLHERTKSFARSFGVTGFQPPDWLWNSRMAMALAEHARDQGKLEPFRRAVMHAHWREGKSIESVDDLGRMVAAADLDPGPALAAARDPELLARVDERQAVARAHGISGIPTFVVGSARIVGCQPYEAMLAAARRGGAVERARTP